MEQVFFYSKEFRNQGRSMQSIDINPKLATAELKVPKFLRKKTDSFLRKVKEQAYSPRYKFISWAMSSTVRTPSPSRSQLPE